MTGDGDDDDGDENACRGEECLLYQPTHRHRHRQVLFNIQVQLHKKNNK